MQDALVAGIITGNTYALIAVGLSLIFGVADLINFAHGSVFAVGAMVGWWLVAEQGWPLWGAMLGVVGVTAVLGLAIERVALRSLANAPPIAPLLSTVAIGLILDRSSELLFSPETRRFESQLDTNNFAIGAMRFGTLDLTILGVSLVSVAALWFFLARSRLGRAVRATAQDRDAASLMGIDINLTIALTFLLGGALAGAAGLLFGLYNGYAQWQIGFRAGLQAFTAAVLGGIGNISGAVLGAFIIGIVGAYSDLLIDQRWTQVVIFSILILILVFRPSGLLGMGALEKA
jgi:branched-chain amino acid transport system permease protein